jgi:hypothetical protein
MRRRKINSWKHYSQDFVMLAKVPKHLRPLALRMYKQMRRDYSIEVTRDKYEDR